MHNFFTEFLSLAYHGVLRTNIMHDDVEHPMKEFTERWSTNSQVPWSPWRQGEACPHKSEELVAICVYRGGKHIPMFYNLLAMNIVSAHSDVKMC